jgi:exo-beta-1,3-glucanase (GH17 family)
MVMRNLIKTVLFIALAIFAFGCSQKTKGTDVTAAEILGNPEYLAFSYGGYRENTRDSVPTVAQLKDDMKILAAMGVKFLRTYNTQQFGHAKTLLEAINQLKIEDSNFEMYVMLGTWIECENAWSAKANHETGNAENNTAEIDEAVRMANQYPDIVKVIAVGNEAMVQWAVNYFVYPNVILKWVNHLQDLKATEELSSDVWITSSDNYESWGGGTKNYQTEDLATLIKAVDYVSLHTYPFHDSHYNPAFWVVPEDEESLSDMEKINAAMLRAKEYAISQYQGAKDYITGLGIDKPIHIGETGWATIAASSYGATGSQAADEYKEKLYYQHMRNWTNNTGMSCFYFEAFNEQWKDKGDILGSENHFGLIKLNGQAKYPLWKMVDSGTFEGLTRDGVAITKTYGGDEKAMFGDVLIPPLNSEMGLFETTTINTNRVSGEQVTESIYVVLNESLVPNETNDMTYPSATLKPNAWEGTCSIEISKDGIIEVTTGTGSWWGSALEIQGGIGEDLTKFENGHLYFDVKGETGAAFNIGFQTGQFAEGDQTNNYVTLGTSQGYTISNEWNTFTIPITSLNRGANLKDVTALIYFVGINNFDGKTFEVRNIYYSQE